MSNIYDEMEEDFRKWTKQCAITSTTQHGLRDQRTKIDLLEKELFLAKLQLSHYQNTNRINEKMRQNIDLNVVFSTTH